MTVLFLPGYGAGQCTRTISTSTSISTSPPLSWSLQRLGASKQSGRGRNPSCTKLDHRPGTGNLDTSLVLAHLAAPMPLGSCGVVSWQYSRRLESLLWCLCSLGRPAGEGSDAGAAAVRDGRGRGACMRPNGRVRRGAVTRRPEATDLKDSGWQQDAGVQGCGGRGSKGGRGERDAAAVDDGGRRAYRCVSYSAKLHGKCRTNPARPACCKCICVALPVMGRRMSEPTLVRSLARATCCQSINV